MKHFLNHYIVIPWVLYCTHQYTTSQGLVSLCELSCTRVLPIITMQICIHNLLHLKSWETCSDTGSILQHCTTSVISDMSAFSIGWGEKG